ncbi:MAG: hypothetical protein KY395_04135 [Actinobacteria bacterium]|nr:hypothetical protein [Actinomycetota bacterium]
MTKLSGDTTESDARELIEMLWRRDSVACVRGDWDAVSDDFDPDEFIGFVGGANGAHWRIGYPTLESYREAWLTGADLFGGGADPEGATQEALSASTIAEIEVRGRRALVRKNFSGKVGPSQVSMEGRTYYFCRNDGRRWRITGFAAGFPNLDPPSSPTNPESGDAP